MKVAILALLALSCAGCSTIGTLTTRSEHRWLYSGTRRNLEGGSPYDCTGLSGLVARVDLPFSAVLDTAVLPLTLPLQLLLGSPARERP